MILDLNLTLLSFFGLFLDNWYSKIGCSTILTRNAVGFLRAHVYATSCDILRHLDYLYDHVHKPTLAVALLNTELKHLVKGSQSVM